MGRGSFRCPSCAADLQLAVVVSSLTQHHPDLAISNILGSCTANILGSFSIGLCFASANLTISDQDNSSSRIYSGLLVIIGGLVALFGPGWGLLSSLFGRREALGAGRWAGIALLVAFAVYLGGIVYGIQRGNIIAPEGSDSDSDTSDEGTSESEDDDEPSEESGDRRGIPILTSIAGEGE
jgi:Ca2+/Na+ antiporter